MNLTHVSILLRTERQIQEKVPVGSLSVGSLPDATIRPRASIEMFADNRRKCSDVCLCGDFSMNLLKFDNDLGLTHFGVF